MKCKKQILVERQSMTGKKRRSNVIQRSDNYGSLNGLDISNYCSSIWKILLTKYHKDLTYGSRVISTNWRQGLKIHRVESRNKFPNANKIKDRGTTIKRIYFMRAIIRGSHSWSISVLVPFLQSKTFENEVNLYELFEQDYKNFERLFKQFKLIFTLT